MRHGGLLLVAACFIFLGSGLAGAKASPTPPPPPAPTFPHGWLEGVPQPLTPKQPRTEAEQDRLEATMLFAAGRAHEQREEYDQALRMYERALRCDPGVNTIAQSIVWLAYRQKQYDVAIRYLKACDPADDDPGLLHHLSMHLLEGATTSRARSCCWSGRVAARGDAKEDVGSILFGWS